MIQPRVETYIVHELGKGQALRAAPRRWGEPWKTGTSAGLARTTPPTAPPPAASTGGRWPSWPCRSRSVFSWCATGRRPTLPSRPASSTTSHKLLGLTILLLAGVRLIYRLVHGAPADEPTLKPWEKAVSHVTHWAIYALLIVVPLLGWLAVSHYGPFEPFGIKLPTLAAQDDARATAGFLPAHGRRLCPDRAAGHARRRGVAALPHPQGRRAAAHVGASGAAIVNVIPGLVPGIQTSSASEQAARWIPATSAGMTTVNPQAVAPACRRARRRRRCG